MGLAPITSFNTLCRLLNLRLVACCTLVIIALPIHAGDPCALLESSEWQVVGGEADWQLVDGVLHGADPEWSWLGGKNSFFATSERFDNFVLELEYQVQPFHNSGVMIRSRIDPQSGFLTGYQVEIDHDPKRARFWAGGIYEESGRGWLVPTKGSTEAAAFSKQGAKLIDLDGWNQLRIKADGSRIDVWLNGEHRSTLDDKLSSEGLIAFQVHAVSRNFFREHGVRFRNVRLSRLASE